jgi:hypothetical protein
MYRKGEEVVFIVLVPPRKPGLLTQFTISRAIPPSAEKILATKKDKPDKLSFMPLYPNAKQAMLMDLPSGGVTAGYTTKDNIKEVIFFYKAQMINYGWMLVQEKPLQEVPIDCPSCKKGMPPMKQGGVGNVPVWDIKGTSKRATLFFQKRTGEMCVIGVNMQELMNVPEEYKVASQEKTNIMVTYNEPQVR